MQSICRQPLTALAWANSAVHILALVLAGLGIRPGSPLVSLEERLNYLAGPHGLWTAAWMTWIVSATLLIGFLAVLADQMGAEARLARLGLIVALIGAAFDLLCDSIYLVVLPTLAAAPGTANVLFLTVERTTGIGSLVIANGAYSLAILLSALDLRRRTGARHLTGIGCAVAGFGFLLAGAGFTGDPWHAAWATPPTIGLFCIWVILVARSFESAGRPA